MESHSHSQGSLRSVVSSSKYSIPSPTMCPTPDVFVARRSVSILPHPFRLRHNDQGQTYTQLVVSSCAFGISSTAYGQARRPRLPVKILDTSPNYINPEQQGVVFQRHRDLKVLWNLFILFCRWPLQRQNSKSRSACGFLLPRRVWLPRDHLIMTRRPLHLYSMTARMPNLEAQAEETEKQVGEF